ncbi:hypothetical protein [Actinomadura roseirufa]|uniref:hypothetical protein n=1 Tax=Actinomadura roseirufa TaxID=2094049 RepID=UPI0010410FF9|nr:hypothetical protein [Actinomadura roseirufa]
MQNKWTAPDYDGAEDFEATRKALGEPERLRAALGLYRQNFGAKIMGTPEWQAEQGALWGPLPQQRTLYLHGTKDNSVVLDQAVSRQIRCRHPWS